MKWKELIHEPLAKIYALLKVGVASVPELKKWCRGLVVLLIKNGFPLACRLAFRFWRSSLDWSSFSSAVVWFGESCQTRLLGRMKLSLVSKLVILFSMVFVRNAPKVAAATSGKQKKVGSTTSASETPRNAQREAKSPATTVKKAATASTTRATTYPSQVRHMSTEVVMAQRELWVASDESDEPALGVATQNLDHCFESLRVSQTAVDKNGKCW